MTGEEEHPTTENPSKRQKKSSDEKKAERKERRKARSEELSELLPGIDMSQYNKQQLRRMRKRVARGLDPLETPKEQHERKVRDAELRREEEAELAGIVFRKRKDENDTAEDEESLQEGESGREASNTLTPEIETGDIAIGDAESVKHKNQGGSSRSSGGSTSKQRNKPVPSDYTCFACKNTIQPAHWIYNCPKKETIRGTNQVSKKQRGLHDPSKCKVFVSGLPFETTVADVRKLVTDHAEVPIQGCKLVKFADSSRCKGQAYVSFRTAEEADKAKTSLNGIALPDNGKVKRKELKLRVTNVLNRFQTAKRKRT